MAGEFEYRLTIEAPNKEQADALAEFIGRIQGVKSMLPIADIPDQVSAQERPKLQGSTLETAAARPAIISDTVYLSRSLGQVVKLWRAHKKLTLRQFAEKAGSSVDDGFLSRLENNKLTYQPPDEKLELVATALDIPLIYLVLRIYPKDDGQ